MRLTDNNLNERKFPLLGKKDSSYIGGLFTLNLIFPKDYLILAQDIIFLTPIYQLNVQHYETMKISSIEFMLVQFNISKLDCLYICEIKKEG